MQNYDRANRFQYFGDILILAGLVIVCALIFGLLGKTVSANVFRMSFSEYRSFLADPSWFEDVENMKIYNLFSTFGAWVASGFVLFRARRYRVADFWRFSRPQVRRTWLLLPVLFTSAVFVASFLLYCNQSIDIPRSVREAFASENGQKLLARMLEMHSMKDLWLNLFVIALVPAVFEEMFFRGTLQPLLTGLTGNYHAGIWICSFLFAAVHLNVMQIIPMFFLALVMGYLYHFTKSLLPVIVVHFCNNGLAVLANYYSRSSPFARSIVEDTYVPGLPEVIFCGVVLLAVLYYFHQQYLKTGSTEYE